MNGKMRRILVAGMLMGAVAWVRADVGVSSQTVPGQPPLGVDPWKQLLGLTNDQTTKFHAAMDAHQTALRSLQQQMRDQKQKIQGLVQSKAGNKDLLASLKTLKSIQGGFQEENDKFDDKLAGFLTPMQHATWAGGMGTGMMHPGMSRPLSQVPPPGSKQP